MVEIECEVCGSYGFCVDIDTDNGEVILSCVCCGEKYVLDLVGGIVY
ncbi:MAG: hypothetical protein ACOCRK_11805 [bacterium]